jgi:hypothetical protein
MGGAFMNYSPSRYAFSRTFTFLLASLVVVATSASCGDAWRPSPMPDVQVSTDVPTDRGEWRPDPDVPAIPLPDVPPPLPRIVSLAIAPLDTTVDVTDATPRPTLAYMVTALGTDGTPVDAAGRVRLSLSDPNLGALDSTTGAFASSGLGGTATVRVIANDDPAITAQTTLTVRVRRTVIAPGAPADAVTRFGTTPPSTDPTAPQLVYPLAGAVMPRNVYPPNLQWNVRHARGADDLYRLRFVRPHATVEVYLSGASVATTDAFLPAVDVWRSVAESDLGEPLEITIAVLPAGATAPVGSAPVAVRTVDGLVAGSVYYWQLPGDVRGGPSDGNARVVRLDPATAALSDPLPAGTCHGCHAVSHQGTQLIANSGAYDMTTDPPTQRFSNAAFIDGRSYNPAGNRIIQSGLQLLDAATGAILTAPGLPSNGVYPEWARDGVYVAYVAGRDASPSGEFGGTADLMIVAPSSGDSFGPARTLHVGSDPDLPEVGQRDWHPTWSPDSRWIAFQHGENARSTGEGALYLIARDSTRPTRLSLATGPTADSYRPHFSPYDSGGYFWLLFSSRRAYGNAASGVPAGSRNQLWVAAVRRRPDGRTDPSEVGYWLPGQRPGAPNLSAYWAPPPCRMNGLACTASSQCCGGNCEPDATGARVCRPPRTCVMRGGMCSVTADCCTGGAVRLICTDAHICDTVPPG